MLAPRLAHELPPARRIGLVQLHCPPRERAVAERCTPGALQRVPHLHRHSGFLARRLAGEAAPRQRARDDELLGVRDRAAREQRHGEWDAGPEGEPAGELIYGWLTN